MPRQYKETARRNYEERKVIEAKLHCGVNQSNPLWQGYEIAHEHRGRLITFTAWDARGHRVMPDKNRRFTVNRVHVLMCEGDFYQRHKDDFDWLIGTGKYAEAGL